ncbi:DGL-beta [Intoshia linei]|uniref:sn-1-specific diacylglycerol lipase n=1 Tax=Intoshia linei TaxID=1819745 RepID=A0A177B8J6_9BILA|nr:DGL-beta [Intoshia linei]
MSMLILFKRRWNISSDDFTVPMIIWCIIVAVVLSILFPISSKYSHDGINNTFWNLILLIMIFLSISIVLQLMIALISYRGAIYEHRKRTLIPIFLYTRLVIYIFEIIWTAFILLFFLFQVPIKYNLLIYAGIGTVLYEIVVFMYVAVSVWTLYVPYGRVSKANETLYGKTHTSWKKRIRLLFCCTQSDNKEALMEMVAEIMTSLFRNDNIVFGDILAGLFIMRICDYNISSPLPAKKDANIHSLKQHFLLSQYYVKYVLATYGWAYMFSVDPFEYLYQSIRKSSKSQIFKKSSNSVEGNVSQQTLNTILRVTGLNFTDILYVNYELDSPAFYVALDHPKKDVIISIRGTMSLNDLLIDLSAKSTVMNIDETNQSIKIGHEGMVNAAVKIKEILIKKGLFVDVTRQFPDYTIVIVGHSLGAATAAVLSILIKAIHPKTKAYCYACPNGLIEKEMLEYTKTFITTTVIRNDIISRLSLQSLKRACKRISNLISECPFKKLEILFLKKKKVTKYYQNTSHHNSFFTDTNRNANEDYVQIDETYVDEKFYLPGKILYITGKHKNGYNVNFEENDKFNVITLSNNSFTDHTPHCLQEMMKSVQF